jgi:hypothetical protein
MPGHERHHWHVPYGLDYMVCSCGGADSSDRFRIVPDTNGWFEGWFTCRLCGQKDVRAVSDLEIYLWP